MFDLVRDSTVGGFLNHISNGRILPYPDQRPGYQLPKRYELAQPKTEDSEKSSPSRGPGPTRLGDPELGELESPTPDDADIAASKQTRLSQVTVTAVDNAADPYLIDWDGPEDPDNPL